MSPEFYKQLGNVRVSVLDNDGQKSVSLQSSGKSALSDIDGFEPCLDALLESLDFAKLSWHECRDLDLVLAATRKSWKQLETAATTDLHRMVKGTYVANADDRTTAKLIDIDELAAKETSRLLRHAPVLPDNLDEILGAVRGAESVRACAEVLARRAAAVIGKYRYALDALRDCGITGRVQHGNRCCVFTYGRIELTDIERERTEESSEETRRKDGVVMSREIRTTTTRMETTVETKTSLSTHCHHLRHPEIHPAPATAVQKPERIERLEACIPSFMKPKYITGDLADVAVEQEVLGSKKDRVVETTQHTQIERQLNRRNILRAAEIAGTTALTMAALPFLLLGAASFVIANDPALVVGNGKYVLSGWLPEELPRDRRYHIQRS